jgi:large repetitive protein
VSTRAWARCLVVLIAACAVVLSAASAGARVSAVRFTASHATAAMGVSGLVDGVRRTTGAADVSGTIVLGGPQQTVTISTPGDKARVTFDGVANARVSLKLASVSIAFSYVSIQKPAGAGNLVSPTPVFSSGKFIDVVTLPSTGVYTIYIDPQSNGTGSMTLTLYDVPPDASGSIVAGGSAVVATTTVPGQNARYTFSGSQGQRISVAINGVSLAPSGSLEIVSLLSPTGSNLGGSGLVTTTGWIDSTTLPTSGVYTILVDPDGAATGSGSLTVYDVPPDATGTLTPSQSGDALSPSTLTPGQNAQLAFAGAQGQRVSLKISGVALSGGGTFETISIRKPDGTTLASSGIVTSNGWIDTQTLPSTGTYTVFVDPDKGAISSSTLRAYDVPPDFAATIDPDSDNAVNETTTVPGQDARLTFTGLAGDTIYVPRGGVTIPTSWVKLLKPDGTQLTGTPLVAAVDGTLSATLPSSGTYTVLVDGYQDAIGNMTLAVTDEDALVGELSADQTPADSVDPDPNPAAPQPTTPTGVLSPGSYTTELWESSEVGNDRGLEVVSSTALGTFAMSGIVKDQTFQQPITGATVTVTVGATTLSTTTDSDGAWAVANMPRDRRT